MLKVSGLKGWWAMTGSNRRHSRCKREETPKFDALALFDMGTGRDSSANIGGSAVHHLSTAGSRAIGKFFGDLALARYLGRRCKKRPSRMICRRRDGTVWAAHSPQNFGYAMLGLFRKRGSFHFVKVRRWRGLFIVSPRIFWWPGSGEFDVLAPGLVVTGFWLPPWPEDLECEKIDARLGK